MARARITEFRAKSLVFDHLGKDYQGVQLNSKGEVVDGTLSTGSYVVKVDQGVKQRMKRGLIELNVDQKRVLDCVRKMSKKGFDSFIAEPMASYSRDAERYLSMERTRAGILVACSRRGGIEIESHAEEIEQFVLATDTVGVIAHVLGISPELVLGLWEVFNQYHFSFLEINPLVVEDDNVMILDMAVEVDTAGMFMVNKAWSETDFVEVGDTKKTVEEIVIEALARKSQASMKFDLINPDGGIFVLLSGGGASIALADEVYNLGYGDRLANYGEYSGNPSDEETYIYTKNVLKLLLASKAKRKVLIIAGGVANFTDVRKTFKGIIRAMDEMKEILRDKKLHVYVRRGGPYQEEGLAHMKAFLEDAGLLGEVAGPELVLTDIITKSIDSIN